MSTVVGIFRRREDAERAAEQLQQLGFPKESLSLLTPDLAPHEREGLPRQQGEQPGIVKGIGAVAGGVMGMTAATLLLPGLGPILAIGMAGGAVAGSLAGGAIGGKVEELVFPGIPEQELFFYEDALRKGRTGIIAVASEASQAEAAKGILEYEGAESIDRARHLWWLGIRDIEKEKYQPDGDFEADEVHFRQGFEAALLPRNRNRTYEEWTESMTDHKQELDPRARAAHRRGFERGGAYLQALQRAA